MNKTLIKQRPETLAPSLATTDFKSMSKPELVKLAEDFILPFSNPEKYKDLIKSSMPEFVKELDDREFSGTAMQEAGQEMMLVIVETLKQSFGFKDSQIKQLLTELGGTLSVAEKVEEGGLSLLSDHSMKRIVQMVKELGVDKVLKNIADIRYQKEKTWASGLEHPQVLEGSNIAKRLQKPGR